MKQPSDQSTSRHVTSFPTCGRIRCVAPDSFIIVAVRVSTVVASVVNAFIRKHVICVVGMFVWRLWRPGLVPFTAHCYRCVADVLTSVQRRIAASTCTAYIQPTILLCPAAEAKYDHDKAFRHHRRLIQWWTLRYATKWTLYQTCTPICRVKSHASLKSLWVFRSI